MKKVFSIILIGLCSVSALFAGTITFAASAECTDSARVTLQFDANTAMPVNANLVIKDDNEDVVTNEFFFGLNNLTTQLVLPALKAGTYYVRVTAQNAGGSSGVQNCMMYSMVSGIAEISADAKMFAAGKNVHIQIPNYAKALGEKITVTNLSGQQVKTVPITEEKTVITLMDVAAGYYVVAIPGMTKRVVLTN